MGPLKSAASSDQTLSDVSLTSMGGVVVAAELAREVAQHFRGIYLITPMVRSGMTAPIVQEFLKTK